MMELTKAPKDSAAAVNDPLSGEGAEDDEEAAGGIANMRVVNASKVTPSTVHAVEVSVRVPGTRLS